MEPKQYLCFLLLFMLLAPVATFAHGDLHERIIAITEIIESHPDSAALYLKRGELYFQHEDYPNSLSDFNKCQELQYVDTRLSYNLAQVSFKLDMNKEALHYLDNILSHDPNYVKAYRLKGNVLFKTKEFEEAARCFEKVIEIATSALPENYMEASLAWENATSDDALQNAVRIIELGLSTKGPLITFYNRLEQLHAASDNLKEVIAVQTEILNLSHRKEHAYFNRGDTYLKMGMNEKAKMDFLAAQSAIAKLNNRIRSRKATIDLSKDIEQRIQQLN